MARPKKNNADYFSHDNSMRNHRKIKALRSNFGSDGYMAYVMFLETLTGSDNFMLELKSELDWKLIAGDFGIEVEKMKEISKEIEALELISFKDGWASCSSLNERLQPMMEKRKRNKELAAGMLRDNNGKYTSVRSSGISVTETPQSKVNERKVKDLLLADKSANDNNPIKPELDNEAISGGKLDGLYKGMGLPKLTKSFHYQWQEEAANAVKQFEDGEKNTTSIHKCFKEHQSQARPAFSDCKENNKLQSAYFFKIYNQLVDNISKKDTAAI